jgi:hypothetical protein
LSIGPARGRRAGRLGCSKRKRLCAARLRLWEHVFVPELRYTVTEYDPERPWVMLTQTRGLVVDLDAQDFPAWAARAWPAPRYRTELEPGTLEPWPDR